MKMPRRVEKAEFSLSDFVLLFIRLKCQLSLTLKERGFPFFSKPFYQNQQNGTSVLFLLLK